MRGFGSCILFLLWISQWHIGGINTTEDSSGDEVDNFIDGYVKEVKRTLRLGLEEHIINKRSYPNIDLNKLTGLEVLVGLQEMYSIPARFPHDIVLFSQYLRDQKHWYSAALETKPEKSPDIQVTELVLYKYQGDEWKETDRVKAIGGENIAVKQILDSVYLVVAQHLHDEDLGSTVWCLHNNSDTLQFVHKLNTHHASHVIMWTDTFTYAAVAISENEAGSESRFSTRSPVYRWLGSYFDMIDALPTYNPQALAQFNIRSSMFVAVANFKNDLGETMIDSDIFLYDLTSGKFNVYQKLPTEAAIDIKYFCFQSNEVTESFLIYASAFHTDERGNKDYNSPSVVYKLSDEEYFVPFQALQVEKVTSWLPVRHAKDGLESLALIGASEAGIISFQYDGWRFVPTGLHYDRYTFGPGPKSLNAFYFNDQTFISVANKESNGYDINVYSPFFKHHPGVENLQKIVDTWLEEMTQEIIEGRVKMSELIRIVQEAPSINDPVIELGSYAEFRNAEIDLLQTHATEVGDSNTDAQVYNQLSRMINQLESLHQSLLELPDRIDRTSIQTHTVYDTIIEDSADITCTHSCRVMELEVDNVNGENFFNFLANTVNIKEPVELEDEVTFNDLGLIDLNTKMINGHLTETLIDWSKPVVVDHKLKVEGDVIAKDSVSVSEAVGGVLINVERKEESFEPGVTVSATRYLESLNTSQLVLSDGKVSEVDFRHFVSSTLKTQGDQIFTEFQDVDKLEADEVAAVLYKALPTLPTLSQRRSCEGKDCSEGTDVPDKVQSRPRASAGDKNIESINLLNDVIIIPHNTTLYGTLIVENGFLSAKDLIDLKHNISAVKVSEFSIPLNQSAIEQHFRFNGELKTPILNVDTLNSLPLTSLVNLEEEDVVSLTGRKVFQGSLTVDGELHVTGTINGVDLVHQKQEEDLEQVDIGNLNVEQINSRNMMVGEQDWKKRAVMRKGGTVVIKSLNVEEDVFAKNVMVRGNINKYNLEKLLNDTVFEGDDNLFITGTKHFNGEVEIVNANIDSSEMTNLQFVTPESRWRKRLLKAKSIKVEKLFYTGKLDGLEAGEFGRWLLTEGDQSMTASQTFTNLQADNMVILPNATFNSVNITHLFTQTVLISDNSTFDSVVFENAVDSTEVEVGGKINDLEIPADIIITDATIDQLITGHKLVRGSVSVAGDLLTFGLVSGVNLTAYCQALNSDNFSLAISGSGSFKQEPEILVSINNLEWSDVMRNIWFKENNVTLLGKVLMNEAEFKNLVVETINNNKVEESLSKLVSLSHDQEIKGKFYFRNIRAEKGLKAEIASVGGNVQGIKLPSFIKDVLLKGVDQEIEGYLDFKSIIIESPVYNKGFVNGLNLSSDVMLADVPFNKVTAELTLDDLITEALKLPPGASVAGVDIGRWNRTAVTKSAGLNTIKGDIIFAQKFDSSRGIRVEHMVNSLPFDQNHVMLSSVHQEITGRKIFSPQSELMIHKLDIEGFLNDINITDFYHQQVTANGNVTISGQKKFTAPLLSERVVLPEIYQDHNLTWLEFQLSAPLPLSSYYGQLATIQHFHQLASQSLAGRAYYLKNMTRMGDVDGDVLFTLPLKSGNASVLGVMRRDNSRDKITLSLLHWSEKLKMFMDVPGSENYFLKVVPSGVKMMTLPGGEIAAYFTDNITSSVGHGHLIRMKDGLITQKAIFGGNPNSTLLSYLDYQSRTCFLVVEERCKSYCYVEGGPTFKWSFPCKNITKAMLFTTDRGTYLLGVQTRPEGSLLLWRMNGRKFRLILELPQFNPVNIAATTTTGPHLAVANMHRLGHSRPETVDIYRLDENTSQLKLEQSLPIVSPNIMVFSSLPTSESVLYVASVTPASPLQIYIYRGILGYQLLTVDPTLPLPSDLQPFTDHQQQHFLVVLSQHMASVFRANF